MKTFVETVITYVIVAAIGVILGEASVIFFGRWGYAIPCIIAVAFTKSAYGWKFE